LYEQIELAGKGFVFDAPYDVQFADTDVVQPDLVVVLAEHRSIIIPSRIRGVPDLVVEILSPSTAANDRTLKLGLYEQHQVPEYWIVDVEDRSVQSFKLGSEGYREATVHRESISFASATVDLAAVWARL
jgi:Uma2 family endonuclease